MWAQVDVQGTVKDEAGEPVIGASVIIEGTSDGTVTDFDGNFLLRAQQGAKLVVSYVGYKSQTLTVIDNRPLSITLSEDTEVLDDVVVIGYGTSKKGDLTGTVSVVNMDEIRTAPVISISQALQGTFLLWDVNLFRR